MQDQPPIINPSWEHVLRNILVTPRPDPRISKWCYELLFPYIEKNPDLFCYRIVVERISGITADQRWDGDRLVELEGYVLRSNPPNQMLNLNMVHDPFIAKVDMTFDNREFQVRTPGWMDNQAVEKLTYKSDTRVTLLLRPDRVPSWAQVVYLFAAYNVIADIGDWLIHAAKVPLTVTKLPFKEAKRLSDEWHEREVRRKAKQREQDLKGMSPGDREKVGHLKVRPGFSTPAEEYEVLWLKDEASLRYESRIQHHCVDTYWTKVVLGQCAILHVRNVDPSKSDDRWTVELSVLQIGQIANDDSFDPPVSGRSFVVVRQMRGITNCNPHPEFQTGFGNLFINRETFEPGSKKCSSSLFTDDSWFDVDLIETRLRKPFGILS